MVANNHVDCHPFSDHQFDIFKAIIGLPFKLYWHLPLFVWLPLFSMKPNSVVIESPGIGVLCWIHFFFWLYSKEQVSPYLLRIDCSISTLVVNYVDGIWYLIGLWQSLDRASNSVTATMLIGAKLFHLNDKWGKRMCCCIIHTNTHADRQLTNRLT